MEKKRGESGGKKASPGIKRGDKRVLTPLHVIDTLEIGPPRVEKRRFTSSYEVESGGQRARTELEFSYDEDVFDPASPADQNLAAMIGAQVALNYGLFCERIVFRGEFDPADRRFIRTMAENTAREIYVKKFLEPNEFLRGEAAALSAVRLDSYLHARLEFPDSKENRGVSWTPEESVRDRVAVSSSGGKDSLLSFGLLREMGYDVHPVFGNESGRHWFTALNAYRDFKESVPNSARVWMNSDRLFAFMLRHLPFVRPDFSRVRSDEYPIRLWTVAVFTFGTLPLFRKRGVGQLVVGDEFDTTDRRTHSGIPHYNGLFDQSRFFDNVLSRYYARKRWWLNQFSILRPLSELLIEKTLVHRYPDLCSQPDGRATTPIR